MTGGHDPGNDSEETKEDKAHLIERIAQWKSKNQDLQDDGPPTSAAAAAAAISEEDLQSSLPSNTDK